MLEAHEIDVYGEKTVIFGPCAPSRHGAAVCRLVQPVNFHDPVWFSTTFLDAPARFQKKARTKIGFYAPRRSASAVAMHLFLARNALLAATIRREDPESVESPAIDGLCCRIEMLPEPGWFRVCLIADWPMFSVPGLVSPRCKLKIDVHGSEALDDFCSGFLKFWS